MLACTKLRIQIAQRSAKPGTRPLRLSASIQHCQSIHFFLILILILALTYSGKASEAPRMNPVSMTLFEFNTPDEASWQVVNDGVMGGRSQGYIAIEEGMLRFTGTLVTRGGGFTSVRTDRHVDLESYAGVELRVRGNGRNFEVEVSDGTQFRGRAVSRRASFETSAEWAVVRVPFRAFRATLFGRPVTVAPIDLSKVKRIGLYILDAKDGPFRLEVDAIRVYRANGD